MEIIKVRPELKTKLMSMRDDYGCNSVNDLIQLFIDQEERKLNKFKE